MNKKKRTAVDGDIEEYLSAQNKNVDLHLSQVLKSLAGQVPKMLHQAMAYSLLAPGKRLRPILAIAACHSVGADAEPLWPIACALEMIHTYSLIQDDLPCMDNDDFRRGQLTCHKVFGEGLAVLASDALLTEAIRLMIRAPITSETRSWIIEEVLLASGASGMVGGQALDLASGKKILSEAELSHLHTLKTGALFCASIRCGAFLGRATKASLESLTTYGKSLGLAFQVVDDVLDATSSLKELGKNPASDQRMGKRTYVDLLGIENAKNYAKEVIEQAVKALLPLGSGAKRLEDIARFVLRRLEK